MLLVGFIPFENFTLNFTFVCRIFGFLAARSWMCPLVQLDGRCCYSRNFSCSTMAMDPPWSSLGRFDQKHFHPWLFFYYLDGRVIDPQLVKQTIAAETERRMIRAGSVVNRLPEAAELLEKFALEPELSEFLTLNAYDKLVSEGK